MARPRKENLDYFPLDTDFFEDNKIRILKAKYGADGIAVYLYILCQIYHDKGYYTECDEDFVLIMSDYFNFSEQKTTQILEYLVSRSLLVKSILSETVTVITAKSVQRRYQEAKKEIAKKAHRDIIVDDRIWLLKKEETEPCIKVQSFDGFSEKNDSLSEKNHGNSEKNAANKSKVNQSKVNESKVVCGKFQIPCKNGVFTVDEEYYTELTHTYPNMNIDECFKRMISVLTSKPEIQKYINGMRDYITKWFNDDEKAGKYRKGNIPNDIQFKGGLNL